MRYVWVIGEQIVPTLTCALEKLGFHKHLQKQLFVWPHEKFYKYVIERNF